MNDVFWNAGHQILLNLGSFFRFVDINPFLIIYILFYILAFIVSIWIGNFITSFYYRIPRGLILNGRQSPPMCSNCFTKLKYPDYGPLYYYLIKGKFCKVCGVKIPKEYFFIELGVGFTIILNFLFNGIGEYSVVNTFFITAIILNFLINLKHEMLYDRSLMILLVFAIIRSCYINGSSDFIYQIAYSIGVGTLLSLLIPQRTRPNYRAFIIILSIGFKYIDFIYIFSFAYIVYLFGILIGHLSKSYDKQEMIFYNVLKSLTNIASIVSITSLCYLLFFGQYTNIQNQEVLIPLFNVFRS
jgi:hypothetical protein